MSLERGLMAINLEMPDKIPHTEYLYHRQYIIKRIGLDPENPAESDKAYSLLADVLDYDFIWSTFSHDWELPKANMGRAQYYETETPEAASYPFKNEEEILAFNPLESAKIPEPKILSSLVEEYYQNGKQKYKNAVFPGGFYNSVFTWSIVTFGWELFLTSAKENPERFDEILEQFLQISLKVVQAHIDARIPVFLSHDDLVWSSGTVFPPEWMRKYIFPKLKRLWAPLKENGIKIMFCSDGKLNEYIDDVAAAGADGFIIEPFTDLTYLTEKYGKSHVMIGNIDTRILQNGKKEDIRVEVKRCADLGKKCPGYFFAVGNHIPFSVPIENVEIYLDAIEEYGKR
jgi:uroporphyrinogen-III decarboxylase